MSSFPSSPAVLKGAIIGLDPANLLASIIVFQYNPDTMTRTLKAQSTTSDNADKGEALRLQGPPRETIKVDVEIDAADQLETADAIATTVGLHPTLASLEMLLYPKSAMVIANEALAAAGVIEIIPIEAPMTLFVWGSMRTLPVRVDEFSITEEAFDTILNPIRAKVSLSLQVLNYQDLGLTSVGGSLFMVHQIAKEVMATISGVSTISGVISNV